MPDHAASVAREKRIVRFLEEAAADASEIHILGDLFDMWFEYKQVVPCGFTRLLGKLSELHDRGIPVHIHIGNHDMWAFDYLPEETGATLHQEPIVREWNGKRVYIGHGDGLGPGDHGYKFIKQVFRNPLMQWCFARLHPVHARHTAARTIKGSFFVTFGQRMRYVHCTATSGFIESGSRRKA